MARARVSKIEGRTKESDEFILSLHKKGWFLEQIRKKHIIGLQRLQRLTRAYDAKQVLA